MTELPLQNPPAHNRVITYTTCRLDEKHVQLRVELKDFRLKPKEQLVHHMIVRLTFDSRLIVTAAEFATIKAPYKECASYTAGPEKLIGISADKGFTKKVFNLYGGVEGCSHIMTILAGLSQAVRQGFVFAIRFPEEEKKLTPETLQSVVQRMANDIENSCMVWKTDSPVQQDVKRGEVRDLPERIYPEYHHKNFPKK